MMNTWIEISYVLSINLLVLLGKDMGGYNIAHDSGERREVTETRRASYRERRQPVGSTICFVPEAQRGK